MRFGWNIPRLKADLPRYIPQFFLFMIGAALIALSAGRVTAPARLAWQVHSPQEPVLRLHVVASSDTVEDQLIKEQVVEIVRRRLEHRGGLVSVGDYLAHARQMLPSLEDEIREHLKHFASGQQVSLAITRSSFPLRAYGTRVFPPGRYLALKVVLGRGKGENWWCLLFPPLCVTLTEAEPGEEALKPSGGEEVEPDEETVMKKGESVRWRFKIVEWWERWLAHRRAIN